MTATDAIAAYARRINQDPRGVLLLTGHNVTHEFRPRKRDKTGRYGAPTMKREPRKRRLRGLDVEDTYLDELV